MRTSAAAGAVLLIVLAQAGEVAVAQAQTQTVPPAANQTVPPAADKAQQPFAEWLAALRQEALARGISANTADTVLTNLEPLAVVIERDRTQAELTLTFDHYVKRRLSKSFVAAGRKMMIEHAAVLDQVATKYGVDGSTLVAIWGMESNYGRFSGTWPTIAALATLAWDPHRPALFRNELFAALEIIDRQEVRLDALKGSWAGAMGQPQFMPSSYLKYAADFDGDARRDIWTSVADVFASIANYLKEHGWTTGVRWGREVKVKDAAATRVAGTVPLRVGGSCQAIRHMTEARPLEQWRALGVTQHNGKPLPDSTLEASLVRVDGHTFLVYANYEALLGYNCAHAYALSVGLLADRLAGK